MMTNDELKAFLEETGFSKTKLAEELGLKQNTIYRYLDKDPIPKTVELALETIKSRIKIRENRKIAIKFNPLEPKTSLAEFGNKLKDCRESKGIKHQDISEKAIFNENDVGLSLSYISAVENGNKDDMTLSIIQKFANALKIEIEVSFGYQKFPDNLPKTSKRKKN